MTIKTALAALTATLAIGGVADAGSSYDASAESMNTAAAHHHHAGEGRSTALRGPAN